VEGINRILLKWWFLFCTQISLSAVAYHFGFFHHLYREDPTRIGFLILGILILTTLWIGVRVHSLKKHWHGAEDAIKCLSPGWFVAESCLVLGLIGTVTGFILMLGIAFINLDVTNVASVQEASSTPCQFFLRECTLFPIHSVVRISIPKIKNPIRVGSSR